MTVAEAVERIDSLKHNTYSREDKVRWLSGVDATVKKLIIDTHEGGEDVAFAGYDDSTPASTVLLVPAPFDEMYLRWLEAQIDYYNAEYGRYNNAIAMFNTSFEAYQNHYNRTHMPKGRKLKYISGRGGR